MELSRSSASTNRLDSITDAAQMRQFGSLLDRCFSVPEGATYLEDFPVWASSDSAILRVGAFDGDRLVACAAARIASLKAPAGALPIGLIGAVATDPEYRGRGLASQSVRLLLKWLEGQGAAMAVLWGSEEELYARMGFELCGNQLVIPLTSFQLPEKRAVGLEIDEGWVPALLGRLQSRPGGLEIREEHRSWISAHAHVEWFWTGWSSNPRAYAAFGRGIDLQLCVHEWGGPADELAAILALIRSRHPDAALLSSPSILQASGLRNRLIGESIEQCLCMAKVLDPRRTLQSFRPGMEPPSSEFLLARLFFGAVGSVEGDASGGSAHFPLPLWFWGLDGA